MSDSDSEEVLSVCTRNEYPAEKLRRVREIFLNKPVRRKANGLATPQRKGRKLTEESSKNAKEITTSEDDSADDFRRFFSNQVDDEEQVDTDEIATEIQDAIYGVRKLCAMHNIPIQLAIDSHIDKLKKSAALYPASSCAKEHLGIAIKELSHVQANECASLRCRIAEHQAAAAENLSRLEREFLHQIMKIRDDLACTIRSEHSHATDRIASMATQLQSQLNRSTLPSLNIPMQKTPKRGPSVLDLQRNLPPLVNRRIQEKLALCSPDMLARVSKFSIAKENNVKEWPKAPVSPRRHGPSVWNHGICREDNNAQHKRLSSRFLRPDEEEELQALKNSLGHATAWMAKME